MSIETNKLMNLGDGQILYNDLRNRMDNQKLTGIKDTPAAIQSFSDAARFPMELKVGIDPVQDLHGYDHPWVGGAGKNLLLTNGDLTANTTNGLTMTPTYDKDGNLLYLLFNGTLTATTDFTFAGAFNSESTYFTLPAGTYTFTKGVNNTSIQFIARTGSTNVLQSTSNPYTFTLSESTNFGCAFFRFSSGTYSSVKLYPQIELGSTATDYEPYSNVCPISGWDGAKVTVTGKNLLESLESGAYETYGKDADSTTRLRSAGFIKVKAGEKYTINASTSSSKALNCYVHCFPTIGSAYTAHSGWQAMPYTFEVPEGVEYFRIMMRFSDNSNIGVSDVSNAQIELGENSTEYESFTGNSTYSISFPTSTGTVYGGELTIHSDGSGELLVDRAFFEFDGSEDEQIAIGQYGGSNKYVSFALPNEIYKNRIEASSISNAYLEKEIGGANTNIGFSVYNHRQIRCRYELDNSITSETARAYFASNPVQFVVPLLDNSITSYVLTPGQVFALLGQNNIWADCGQINYLEYVRDTVGEVIPNRFDGIDKELHTYEKSITESSVIQSFDDGTAWPMGLNIAVDPVQDLHGYNNPWPAGGGKNIYHNEVGNATSNGVTYTVQSDETIKLTASSGATNVSYYNMTDRVIPAGNYTFSGCPTGGSNSTYKLSLYNVTTQETIGSGDVGSGNTFTANGTDTYRLFVRIESGYNPNGLIYKPMICLSTESEPTTYAPYSNVCPISGWTVANVTATGKNLAGSIGWTDGYYINENGEIVAGGTTLHYSDLIRVKKNTEYVYSGISGTADSSGRRVHAYDEYGNWLQQLAFVTPQVVSVGTAYSISFLSGDAAYIRISTRKADTNLQIEEGTTATSYDSSGTVYPITFPSSAGTVYGGELTVNKDGTGELVATHESLTPNASDYNWNSTYNIVNFSLNAKYQVVQTPICNTFRGVSAKTAAEIASSYPGCCATSVGLGFININSNFATLEEFKAYATTNPITFVLKLATPITYTLSAPQVLSLIGKNNVWADCGDILSLTYNSKQGLEFIREDTVGQLAPVQVELNELENKVGNVGSTDLQTQIDTINTKITHTNQHNNLSDASTLSGIFSTLRSDTIGTGYGEIGNLQDTNLKTLLTNPGIGNYVRCNMRLIDYTAILCVAVSQATNGIKIKYLYHAEYSASESYYYQTNWISV